MADTYTAADRLRPLRPSDAAVWAVGQLRELTDGGKDFLVCLAVGAIGVYLLLPTSFVATVLVMLAPLAGLQAGYTARVKGAQGWLTERTAVLLSVLVAVVGLVLLFLLGWTLAASLWSLGAWEAFARRPSAPKRVEPWWSHRRLVDALVTAGVLSNADGTPAVGYIGKAREDAAGRWQTVRLPAGVKWQAVKARHSELASAMGLPEERLHLEHERGQPANAVTIVVLADRAQEVRPATAPDRTTFADGVPLGVDRLGRPVTLATRGTHTVCAGATNSGKTRLARWQATHSILDPSVPLYVISGKDDRGDWRPMRPLCVRYAGGTSAEAITEALGILDELLTVSELRAEDPDAPTIHVVVDEWYMVRTQAAAYDRQLGEALDKKFSILLATVRSRNVHITTCVQRGTTDYLPGHQRANVLQRCVGMMGDTNETRYVMERRPEVHPAAPGEFLVSIGGAEPTLVAVPNQGDDAFAEVCDRAAKLRADEPHAPVLPEAATGETSPPDEPDELTAAVWAVLGRRGPLKASDLWPLLPVDLRPGGAAPLGKALGRMPHVRETWDGNIKKWEHVPPPRRLPVALPPEEHALPPDVAVAAPGDRGQMPPERASDGPVRAATGTDGAVPPVLAVVP